MTSKMIERIEPTVAENGITFYVSKDGEMTGVSQTGLARLCGLQADTLRNDRNMLKTLEAVSINTPVSRTTPESLKAFTGAVFAPCAEGSDGARIVTSEAAVTLIEYYALERGNEVAKVSYRKFARMGFDSWVKKVTQFTVEAKPDRVFEALQYLIGEVTELKALNQEYNNIRGISATVYPGMDKLMDEHARPTSQTLLGSDNLYTVVDWLRLKGIELDKSSKYSLALTAAQTYKAMTGQDPKNKFERTEAGNTMKKGRGYRGVDFPILEIAYSFMLEREARLRDQP